MSDRTREALILRELRSLYRSVREASPFILERARLLRDAGLSCEDYPDLIPQMLGLSYPCVSRLILYPDEKVSYPLRKKLRRLRREISLESWGDPELRAHCAVIAAWELVDRYFRMGKGGFMSFLLGNIPWRYMRILNEETERGLVPLPLHPKTSEIPFLLPGSGREYLDSVLQGNTSAFCQEFYPYLGRTNLYRLARS